MRAPIICLGLTLLIVSTASAQVAAPQVAAPAPAPAPLPVGMVDQPCAPGSSGRLPGVEAMARELVKDGPMDMSVMKTYAKDIAESAKIGEAQAKNDWANLCLYRAADAEGAKVVFLGDSITELWRVADPDFFTQGVVDRGISGQTSPQALLRFQQDVVALHPRVVHIMIGTNDVAGNTGPNRPEDLKNNIRAMVDMAKAHHIAVVLASIPPASVFAWNKALHPAPQIKALNAWLAGYAKQEGLVYVDYWSALANAEGGMRDGLSRDGVHPLVSGYRIMEPLAKAAIAKAEAQRR